MPFVVDQKLDASLATIEKNIDKLTNIDAEVAVIGCLLWDNRSYEKIADFLSEEHFSDQKNKEIFGIIKKLLDQNILVTPVTLKNHLQDTDKQGINNLTYLNQIKDSAPSTHNALQYANLLYDLHIKRSLISIGNEIINQAIENKDLLEGKSLIENAQKYKATGGKLYNEDGEYSTEYINYLKGKVKPTGEYLEEKIKALVIDNGYNEETIYGMFDKEFQGINWREILDIYLGAKGGNL